MVVGAFGTDKLLMFRMRPVINVMSTMESTPSRIAPRVTSSNRCRDRPDTSCIELKLCFQFTTKLQNRSVIPQIHCWVDCSELDCTKAAIVDVKFCCKVIRHLMSYSVSKIPIVGGFRVIFFLWGFEVYKLLGCDIKLHQDRTLCESMNEIRSVTWEITFWNKKKKTKKHKVQQNVPWVPNALMLGTGLLVQIFSYWCNLGF